MINCNLTSKRVCLLTILTIVALVSLICENTAFAQQQSSQPLLDTSKFSIDMPKGWEHHIQTSSGFKALFIMAPRVDDFSPNINILIESTSGAALDKYLKYSRENMKKANMIVADAEDFIAINLHGKCFTSTFNYQGRNIALKTYLFEKNGVGYVITGSCLVSQKEKYRPIFDKTVKTFKLK